jgi:SulP family sulfate permease
MALVMVTLVKEHGLDYLLAATILAGILQMLAGFLRLGQLMQFVSRSVITGFVNALAILIFMAQLPELTNVSWPVYAMTAAGLLIIYGLPYFTKAVPSPLVAIIVLSIAYRVFELDIRTVGDMGALPDSLPSFLIPQVPFTWETLQIILPYSATLCVVGLLESLMTATIVDDMTDTGSNKDKECVGQGIANIATGFMGGMAGCAMIGQSVINVKSGGRGRLSTLTAGVILLILVVFLDEWVRQIPMAALVAVMIMVSISTFNWGSVKDLVVHPKTSSVVMLATVVVTVATHDLAKGVLTGVLFSGVFFAHKVRRILHVVSTLSQDGQTRSYLVSGQVFFASSENFTSQFDYQEKVPYICIDVSQTRFWDLTSVDALDRVVLKLRRGGSQVDVHGLDASTSPLVKQFASYLKIS